MYHGEVPLKVIQKSAKFIKNYVDLSGLSEEYIHILTNSLNFDPVIDDRDKIYEDLVAKGYDYNTILGMEERLTDNVEVMVEIKQPIVVKLFIGKARGRAKDSFPEYYVQFRNFDPGFAEKITVSFGPLADLHEGDIVKITNYSKIDNPLINATEYEKLPN